MTIPKEQTPLLRGFLRKNHEAIQLDVWCPYCDALHTHGWPPGAGWQPQHRWAHCYSKNESPLRETGYRIAPYRVKDLKILNMSDRDPPKHHTKAFSFK